MKKKQKPEKFIEAPSLPNDTRTTPLHQDIATQAYVLWQHYGQPEGQDVSIWLEAERQVLGVDDHVNQQAGGAVEAKPLGSALAADFPTVPEGNLPPPHLHR